MLVSQVYSHKYVRYFAYKNIYSLPRSRNGLSLLLNSAISWVWWGTAPPAPNVETPLIRLPIRHLLQYNQTQMLMGLRDLVNCCYFLISTLSNILSQNICIVFALV